MMFRSATPLLHVSNSATAQRFYCDQLGFRLEFAHRANQQLADPCYMGLSRDECGSSSPHSRVTALQAVS